MPGLAMLTASGHINNLYNTTFWTMVQRGGMSNTDAEQELKVRRFEERDCTANVIRALYPRIRMRFFSSGSESTTTMKKKSIRRAVCFTVRSVTLVCQCLSVLIYG